LEETGIEVRGVTYHSLQPWPGVVAPEARVLEPISFTDSQSIKIAVEPIVGAILTMKTNREAFSSREDSQ